MANLLKFERDNPQAHLPGLFRIRNHYTAVNSEKSNGVGIENFVDVRDSILGSMDFFADQIMNTRRGKLKNKQGVQLKPLNISFDKACKLVYGCTKQQYLKAIGVNPMQMSYEDVAKTLGAGNVSKQQYANMIIDYGQFNSPFNTSSIDPNFRFLLPEIILDAIRIAYEQSSQASNWTATSVSMDRTEVKMPRIERGDTNPYRLQEGEDIPIGTLKFGQKTATVFEVGMGFNITDQLVSQSTIDLANQFLQEVGVDMAISRDSEARRVLINGEQTDSSESAAVIGVENITNNIDIVDVNRVTSRMEWLRRPANRVITNEDIRNKDLNDSRPERDFTTIADHTELPVDLQPLTLTDTMFIDSTSCMAELNFGGLRTETERNASQRQEYVYVTNWVGYAIIRRESRVIVRNGILFSSNGFPAGMDVRTRLSETFR